MRPPAALKQLSKVWDTELSFAPLGHVEVDLQKHLSGEPPGGGASGLVPLALSGACS